MVYIHVKREPLGAAHKKMQILRYFIALKIYQKYKIMFNATDVILCISLKYLETNDKRQNTLINKFISLF